VSELEISIYKSLQQYLKSHHTVPVQRHRLPSKPSSISCLVGRAFSESKLKEKRKKLHAIITITRAMRAIH
jgi:hypothetical protein